MDVELAKFIFLFSPLPIPSLLIRRQIFFHFAGGGPGGPPRGRKKLGPRFCTLDPARKGKRAVWAPAGSSLHLPPGKKSGRAPAIASRAGWAASRCRLAHLSSHVRACTENQTSENQLFPRMRLFEKGQHG